MIIWFALVQVKAINGNTDLGAAIGAFVNVAYRASSKIDFLDVLTNSFSSFDFEVVDVEDICTDDDLDLYIQNPDKSEKLILLKRIIDGEEFTWGTFHTYLIE